jgi:hypothetical protein
MRIKETQLTRKLNRFLVENNVTLTQDLMDDIAGLVILCENINLSKQGRYEQLDAWLTPIYLFTTERMYLEGFVNANKAQTPPIAKLWFLIKNAIASIVNSPFVDEEVDKHHTSAFGRNQALIAELNLFLSLQNYKKVDTNKFIINITGGTIIMNSPLDAEEAQRMIQIAIQDPRVIDALATHNITLDKINTELFGIDRD